MELGTNKQKVFTNDVLEKLKKTIIKDYKKYSMNYSKNLQIHFEIIKKDFYKKSLLSYEVAKYIVMIRRKIQLDENLEKFFYLVRNENEHLANNLNIRWIVSVMDTIADYGEKLESALALLLSLLVNMVKMCETEKKYFYAGIKNPRLDDNGSKEEIFDGLTYFNLYSGDMLKNLLHRIDSKIILISYLKPYYGSILKKLESNNNFFAKIKSINIPYQEWRKQFD